MLDELSQAAARQRANHSCAACLRLQAPAVRTRRGQQPGHRAPAGRAPRRAARRPARRASSTTWRATSAPTRSACCRPRRPMPSSPTRQHLIALTQARRAAAPGAAAAPQPHAGRHRARIVRMRRALLAAAAASSPSCRRWKPTCCTCCRAGSTPASCRCSGSTGTRPRKLLEQIIRHEAVHADRRLGRPAPPPAARPALLRLLPPAAARRAADLRRGGAAARDAGAIAPLIDKASTPLPPSAVQASPRSTRSATASRACATCRSATS